MLTQLEVPGNALGKPRTIWVQTALAVQPEDCVIFLDAEFYIEKVQAPAIIADMMEAGELPNMTTIYVSHEDVMERGTDFTCNQTFTSFVAIDLCQWIEQTVSRFERIFLCGLSLSGLAAIFATLQHPTRFHGILAQSPSAWWEEERLARSLIHNGRSESRIWISVGDQETEENVLHSPVGLFQKVSQRDSVRRLAEKLQGRCREIHFEEFSGGHEMACWAKELPRALPWLMKSPGEVRRSDISAKSAR